MPNELCLLFKLYPAKCVYKQRVKLRPNEHHYENEGEQPYIKYSCRICEQLAEEVKSVHSYIFEENEKFVNFSFLMTNQLTGSSLNYPRNFLIILPH